MTIELENSDETEAFGALLWRLLPEKCLVFLHGDLGAGKTTLARGLLRAAGYSGVVKSPTYGLVEDYQLDQRRVLHFDLYRLQDPEELEWLGMADYLAQPALCLVEWPQQGQGLLPEPDVELSLRHSGEKRVLQINIVSELLKNRDDFIWKNKDLFL